MCSVVSGGKVKTNLEDGEGADCKRRNKYFIQGINQNFFLKIVKKIVPDGDCDCE